MPWNGFKSEAPEDCTAFPQPQPQHKLGSFVIMLLIKTVTFVSV